jgi:hypothetical protein
MATMTNQEIFNKVLTHLRTQGSQAKMFPEGSPNPNSCAYRGHNGTMCAVGCLIEDKEYEEDFEFLNISGVITMRKFKNFNKSNLGLLNALQKVHDSYCKSDGDFLDFVNERFKRIAEEFKLIYFNSSDKVK